MLSASAPRVLSVLHSLEPGGVERDVLRFTAAWREQGIDARIALGRWEGALRAEAPDVPYIVPPPGRLARIETESLWMMQRLPAIIREVRPDVLFLASNGLMAVGAAMQMRLGRQCPPIVLRISNSLDRPETGVANRMIHRQLLRWHSHIYEKIVAMAPPLRDEIVREMAVPSERVVTIENAALTKAHADRLAQLRDRTKRNHAGRHFLAIGRLAPQKNFLMLLEAFARVARADDRLTILGEGTERHALDARARALGVDKRLDLPGQVRIDEWLAKADAFVLSSDFEGVPAVLIEALAAGLPIVATRCAVSIPMLVEGAGQLVPPRDVAALAKAMDEICDSHPDISAMRERAAGFTIEATLSKWTELLNAVTRN